MTAAKKETSTLEGLESLSTEEHVAVSRALVSLLESLKSLAVARLAVGEHLYTIQQVLEPRRIFTKFLNAQTHLSRATAYRYIDLYVAAAENLPTPVMDVVMQRGVDTINLKRVEKNPPPKTSNVVKINEWVDSIQKPETREPSASSPETLKRECYNFVHARFQRLPSTGKARAAWMTHLMGMMLTELGVSSPQTIEPQAIPAWFRKQQKVA